VEISAGKEVILEPGFESSPNFIAYIEPCFDNIQLKHQFEDVASGQDRVDDVADPSRSTTFKCYPDPTLGQVMLDLSGSTHTEIPLYRLYDSTGQLIEASFCKETRCIIDLNGQASGIYLLSVQTGHRHETIRIVKQ
jgi:hypothetical protein